MLRLPEGMRDRIKAAADASGRSMNAEIVAALEVQFPDRDPIRELLSKAVETLEILEKTPDTSVNELQFANRVVDEARGLYHASKLTRGIDVAPGSKLPRSGRFLGEQFSDDE